jgi:hypothetical protein
MFEKQNNKSERGGQLKVKIHILLYGDNSRTVTHKQEWLVQ